MMRTKTQSSKVVTHLDEVGGTAEQDDNRSGEDERSEDTA